MRYTLGKQLKGMATTGQKIMVRRLLGDKEGLEKFLERADAQLASQIIDRARGGQ